ncbi:MAG: PEP-CTERM sorting domain-containing protein, partial [Desulfobulbus sp.]|nr:PEP-CTERM sorting domain-containing protein [Desulfobulbus sp.]
QLQGLYHPSGTKNTNYGLRGKDTPFDNLQLGCYWFGTPTKIDDVSAAWLFDFEFGTQFKNTLGTDKAYAIAVRSASPVPEPSSAALFLIGLFPLARIRSRQNH